MNLAEAVAIASADKRGGAAVEKIASQLAEYRYNKACRSVAEKRVKPEAAAKIKIVVELESMRRGEVETVARICV